MLYIEEPLLEFRHGQRLVYPRDGLCLYGPTGDTTQLQSICYGVVGTPDGGPPLQDMGEDHVSIH